MAELKTKQNDQSVVKFLNAVEHDKRREDALVLLDLMKDITGEDARMWGDSIVGFGSYHYTYASGREGDWMLTGFSPRKQNLSVYIMDGFEHYGDLLAKLGKHKTAKSCLYINKLEDIDLSVLKRLVKQSFTHMQKLYS
ncbi:MAG: DUF1801 domain-containing protein [Gammaproteobacteria bacterium]|nr:DUF1801 domain-containing protein [Gammaproteobacteria bacterium]